MSDDALQAATSAFGVLQQEMSAVVDARQRLEAQKAENDSVKKVNGGFTVFGYSTSLMPNCDVGVHRASIT